MKFFYSLVAAAFCTTAAQAAWVVPIQNLACTMDINEWGYSSSCSCPEASEYNEKIGQCMYGEAYPILVSGVVHSKNPLKKGVTLETEYGVFKLLVKQSDMEKLLKADEKYFEVEGEFVLLETEPAIIADSLHWLQ